MDLRQLRHFVAVVELGSLTRASQQLNLTQPALTRSVKTLELSVATQLLERSTHGINVTQAGKALYQHAKFMLTHSERIHRDVRMAANATHGELMIVMEPAFAELNMHRAIGRFMQQYGGVSIKASTHFVEQAVPMLLDGHADLAVIATPAETMAKGLDYVPLAHVQMAAYAASDHPLAALADVTCEALAGARWALLDHRHADDMITRYFATGRQPTPSDVLRTDSLGLIRQLVLEEGYVALLPMHIMAGSSAVRLPAPDLPITRWAGILTRSDAPTTPAMEGFIAMLREEFAREEFAREGLASAGLS